MATRPPRSCDVYGFFPDPNDGEFVKVYENVQDLIDDDRFVDEELNLLRCRWRRSSSWSMLAVEAPPLRPGGAQSHLLGLRVVHARENQLAAMRDDDVPRIGHSTFVWTEGDEPCGMWDPDRFLSCFFDESCDSDEWLWDDDDARDRDATDRAALVQACTRCEEILRDDFATTLEEDQVMLDEIEEAIRGLSPEEADEDPEGHLEYVAALRYGMSVKRILRDFISECKRRTAWRPRRGRLNPNLSTSSDDSRAAKSRLGGIQYDNRRINDHALATPTRSGRARSAAATQPRFPSTAPPRPPGSSTSQLCAVLPAMNRLTLQLSSPNVALTALWVARQPAPSYAARSAVERPHRPQRRALERRHVVEEQYAPPG